MNVRFKRTNKGEVAILPRKEYEVLAAKAQEADEDFGTARLVARARKEIAAGMPLIPKQVVDRIAGGESALRALREWRGKTQLDISYLTRLSSDRVTFPTWKADDEREQTAALKKMRTCSRFRLTLSSKPPRKQHRTIDHQIKAPQPNWSDRGRRRCASSMGPHRPIGPLGKR
jgi:hypothetical protein